MCGISGAIFPAAEAATARALVERIAAAQHARGPDARDVQSIAGDDRAIVLGHNRLSIIDRSDTANQPMWNRERTVCLVFNGEVYNYLELREELSALGHVFRTRSDSEVLLEAFLRWGAACASRFIGMFAFAIWDARSSDLWLVRDRFGVKPLYYRIAGDRLAFASTPGAIAAHFGLAPDLAYLIGGIEAKVYEQDSPISPFAGLLALEAGCAVRIACASRTPLTAEHHRWYDLETIVRQRRERLLARSDADWVAEAQELLISAVRLRLRSDVPLGVSLSGGLDSSTITALAAAEHQDLTAFSFGDPRDQATEGPVIKAIGEHCRVRTVFCSPSIDELCQGLLDTLRNQGAPFPTGSIIGQHFVFKTARAHGVTVLLGGQGADEALMGYHKYKIFVLQHAVRTRNLRSAASQAIGLGALLGAELANLGDFWSERHRFLARRSAPAGNPIFASPQQTLPSQGLASGHEPWNRQVLDFRRFSLPTLLRYEDRNSMGNSIESRLPFMDHRLVEFGIALPDAIKVRHGLGKWVLRQVADGLIPRSVRCTRRKRGFDVDQKRWIAAGLGAFMRHRLDETRGRYQPWTSRNLDIPGEFSDQRLITDKRAFAEAVSLLWLGDL